jgi:hypothetical protein
MLLRLSAEARWPTVYPACSSMLASFVDSVIERVEALGLFLQGVGAALH